MNEIKTAFSVKNFQSRALLCLVAALFLGCAGERDYVINSDIDSNSLSGRNLYIMPILDIYFGSGKEFKKAFANDSEALMEPKNKITRILYEKLSTYVDHVTLQIDSSTTTVDSNQFSRVLTIPRNKGAEYLRFNLPSEDSLERSKKGHDLILEIDKMEFYPVEVQTPNFGGMKLNEGDDMTGIGSITRVLSLKFQYIIWDYRKKAPVVYGTIKNYGTSTLEPANSKYYYMDMIADAAETITRHSQLRGNKISRIDSRKATIPKLMGQ